MFEGRFHRTQFLCLTVQLLDTPLSQGLDLAAWSATVLPQSYQLASLGNENPRSRAWRMKRSECLSPWLYWRNPDSARAVAVTKPTLSQCGSILAEIPEALAASPMFTGLSPQVDFMA